MKNGLIILAVMSIAAAVALLAVSTSGKPDSLKGGPSKAPVALAPSLMWELKDVDGRLVKSSAFAGKVVLLDFSATWCGPCRLEIPGFLELQKQNANNPRARAGALQRRANGSTLEG
jgi:thiol-disulfide isomerase/thioredoxin